MTIDVRITRLPHGADLPLPSYQSAHAAGLDLIAAVPADAPLTFAPGARALVPTGIAIALVTTEGVEPWPPQTKDAVAEMLIARIANTLGTA